MGDTGTPSARSAVGSLTDAPTSPAENSPFVADEESVVDPEVVTPSVICRHAGCGAPTEGVGPKSQLFLFFGTVAV